MKKSIIVAAAVLTVCSIAARIVYDVNSALVHDHRAFLESVAMMII